MKFKELFESDNLQDRIKSYNEYCKENGYDEEAIKKIGNDKYSLYDEEDRYKEMNSKELNKFLDKMKKILKDWK